MFTNETYETALIPGIVVRNLIPLPNNEIKLEIKDEIEIRAINEALKNDRYIAMLVPKNSDDAVSEIESINNVCAVGKIITTITVEHLTVRILIICRAKVNDSKQENDIHYYNVTSMPKESDDPTREFEYVKLLINELDNNGSKAFSNIRDVSRLASSGLSLDKFADILAFNMQLDNQSKFKYLETPSTTIRLRYVLEDVKRVKQLATIDAKIEEDVRESINQNQKEYYLREKIKAIQNELGDKAKKDTEVDELRQKIIDLKMPKETEKKMLAELSRYAYLGAGSGESAISKTYLDFVVSLPWNNRSIDCKDIKQAKDQLDSDHYGLEKVKDRILEYLAVKILNNKNPQAILCLVGPPGVGKTSLGRSIAAALNKKFVKQSLGGVKDESEIRGHRRTYLGALPGRILSGMQKAGVKNPVFLLDEVDKLTSDFRGDPSSALLEVLDSEQNKAFSDHYLEEPFDLSEVFFIATANYLENIPAPLRDRMEIVELSSYTEVEKYEIAKRHLIDKQLLLHGLNKCQFELQDDALWDIIRLYTREAGVRELERYIGSLIRKAIKSILLGESEKVVINSSNLQNWIGKPLYHYNVINDEPKIGSVTGLAYTQYGGDTLEVEASYHKGKGGITLTGKLGDVMKESAQIAFSYVKANAEKYNIDPNVFAETDVHIHFPEGAVPKDGPSAGVTMATAIISLFSNTPVNNKIGMTGEISLRGNVLPIGGLREKSIAASRSGLEKILIPFKNEKDIDEIPESVRNKLDIVLCKTIDDVVNEALIRQ